VGILNGYSETILLQFAKGHFKAAKLLVEIQDGVYVETIFTAG
jgi:hypothetical protein